MKKIYSLLAIAALTATVNAQVFSENFDTVTGTGGNTGGWNGSVATGSLTGKLTGWTLASGFGADKCIKLGSGSNMGSAITPTITTSENALKLTFKAGAWDGNNEKLTITVSVASGTATLAGGAITLTKGAFSTYTVNLTNVSGPLKLKFSADVASNNRFFLDDVLVEAAPTMAVVAASKVKANLVKNTIVVNELIFGTSAKVSLYNTAGQVVKTADVAENFKLDVSSLPKGTYIVTGLVNGQAISQKIIKK